VFQQSLAHVLPLSVVIPTLGGDSLDFTLNGLNAGPKVPAEIIVCIPEREYSFLQKVQWANVRILKTSVRGQVAQRAEGFNQVCQPYVLQLDDDVKISSESMQKLIKQVTELGTGSAVAPVYLNEDTGECVHRHPTGLRGLLSNFWGVVIGGVPWGARRMGCITAAGTCYGVDPDLMEQPVRQVQWLPGGCVMHHAVSLVNEDFFPFSGKAYCEDLIHSYLLRKRGVRLYVVKAASCIIESPVPPREAKELAADIRARLYFSQLRGASQLRFWIWQIMIYLKRVI
jgi:hypothetical protein